MRMTAVNKSRPFLVLICTASVFLTFFYYRHVLESIQMIPKQLSRVLVLPRERLATVDMDDRYVLRTPGCLIESLDPWHPTLRSYFYEVSWECSRSPYDVLIEQTDDGYLIVNQRAKLKILQYLNQINATLKCQKRKVFRNNTENNDLTASRLSRHSEIFDHSIEMKEEYAQVICSIKNTTLYHNYFFNVIRKSEIEAECAENYKEFIAANPQCANVPQLSVLVLGIDSLSRTNFIRQMPRTFDFVHNKFSAIDMLGYNKVGINTFPCLIPYLTGNSSDELSRGCWGGNLNAFDNCTFLWDDFRAAGYLTAFVENMDYAGLFTFNRGGLMRTLAHYYSHVLYRPVETFSLKHGCWRGKPDDERLAEWAYKFQRLFANTSHFGHFWMSSFSHSEVNMVQNLDVIMEKLFKKMYEEELLKNTLLIFMSDHGIRYGEFRSTEKGRQEENLPFMFFVFPQDFVLKYPKVVNQVKSNRHRLITVFDLHQTLQDVIKCRYVGVNSLKIEKPPKSHRGISLFQPISGNRTCSDAGIPAVFCACKENIIQMNPKSSIAVKKAKLLVNHLNFLTYHLRNICVEFYLTEIKMYKTILTRPQHKETYKKVLFNSNIIAVLVNPGEAEFEANLMFNATHSSYHVHPDVRRINSYGDSSHCVKNDAFLKSICYCKEQLN